MILQLSEKVQNDSISIREAFQIVQRLRKSLCEYPLKYWEDSRDQNLRRMKFIHYVNDIRDVTELYHIAVNYLLEVLMAWRVDENMTAASYFLIFKAGSLQFGVKEEQFYKILEEEYNRDSRQRDGAVNKIFQENEKDIDLLKEHPLLENFTQISQEVYQQATIEAKDIHEEQERCQKKYEQICDRKIDFWMILNLWKWEKWRYIKSDQVEMISETGESMGFLFGGV